MIVKYYADNGIISISLILLTISTSLIFSFFFSKVDSKQDVFQEFMSISISTSATIFAVIIAAFGFYAAMTDIKFSESLLKMGQLENALFPFLIVSVLWSLTIITSLIFKLVIKSSIDMNIKILFYVDMLLLALSIFFTISLIYDTLKLTIYRAYFSSKGVVGNLNEFRKDKIVIEESKKNSINKFIVLYIISSVLLISLILFFVIFLGWSNTFFGFIYGMVFFAWNILTYKSIKYMNNHNYLLGMNLISSTYKVIVFLLSVFICYLF